MLHGWSASSNDLKPLANFLKDRGFNVVDIWLADYLSMHDEITIQDLGQAMGKAIEDKKIPQTPQSFDVIVHSTGGLVIRQYLIHYFFGQPAKCPIKHLLMLAPANFGSPLAHLGKSMVGRLRVGWNWDHMFQSGTRVLDALELASPVSWNMAKQDLFHPKNKIFSPANMFTTVLVGTDAYTGLPGVIHENGSDGTVRVSTANLNASYLKLVFKQDDLQVEEQKKCYDPIAFGVLYNKNHGTIIQPNNSDDQFTSLILESLSIKDSQEYKKHIQKLAQITDETFAKGMENNSPKYHQYQHVVMRVHDQFDEDIKDYFIEFYQEKEGEEDRSLEVIQTQILEKVIKYANNQSFRSFLFDITDMQREILDQGKTVEMSLCAAAVSKNISYLDPKGDKGYLTIVSKKNSTFLNPNTTLFIDIELPRIQSEKVFQLKKI